MPPCALGGYPSHKKQILIAFGRQTSGFHDPAKKKH
jgi:hypothetical protein